MNERRWNDLQEKTNETKSVHPYRRLVRLRSITEPDIPELPAWAHEGYIFAFPDTQAPEPWKQYKHGKEEWNILTRDIGEKIIGVRFDIRPSDEAYVVNRAEYANYQWGHTENKQDAITKYALSRVPASNYDGSFEMPELIIRNPIRLERLILTSKSTAKVVHSEGKWTTEYEFSPTN